MVQTQQWRWSRAFCVNHTIPISTWLLGNRHLSTKLFIGGLSYDTNETLLKHAFQGYGEIVEVIVICDHVSGESKGYGFVKFDTEVAASTASKAMDGQLLDGRNIRVCFAQKQ